MFYFLNSNLDTPSSLFVNMYVKYTKYIVK